MANKCCGVDYGYGPCNGPHTWCLTAHDAAGRKQSPINIITHQCKEHLEYPPLIIKQLLTGPQMLERKRHNFQVSFPQSKAASIEGGPLRERYVLEQFHFHWGNESQWGSEHQVDGHSFSAELHLVFLASKYREMKEAMTDPEGLCVVGIFLQAVPNDNPAFKPLVDAVKPSQKLCKKLLEREISIFSFLPDLHRFYTYEGSLTTPPCAECVRWIVCADPIPISDAQLDEMRSMHKCEDCGTCETFRGPLPLGQRAVTCSFTLPFNAPKKK